VVLTGSPFTYSKRLVEYIRTTILSKKTPKTKGKKQKRKAKGEMECKRNTSKVVLTGYPFTYSKRSVEYIRTTISLKKKTPKTIGKKKKKKKQREK
jgi:hypothetical protein